MSGMARRGEERSNIHNGNRNFGLSTIRQQRTHSLANMATSFAMNRQSPASSNRPTIITRQTNIPAPSSLKLPQSTGLSKKVGSVSSSCLPQTTAPLKQQASTGEGERKARRGSYTISTDQGPSGGHPVVDDKPYQPDRRGHSAASGSYGVSDLLNTTRTFECGSWTQCKETELREAEFRNHLNRPVCIGGAKWGLLRYFGPLHMVDGLFCGIELEESVGQHDGQIDGRRYFRTGHNRGIFAPMEKVELIGKELVTAQKSRPAPAPTAAELIIPPDAEYLTDVEPHFMGQSFVGHPATGSANDSFDLSESLMFLKGSRFPGMDATMSVSQAAAELGNETDSTGEPLEGEDLLPAEDDLETAYLAGQQQRHLSSRERVDDELTPILEQQPEHNDFDAVGDFKTSLPSSTPVASIRHLPRTPVNLDKTVTVRSRTRDSSDLQSEATSSAKERPISTISADTGYQGDTEYETQSGRSISPRERDISQSVQQKETLDATVLIHADHSDNLDDTPRPDIVSSGDTESDLNSSVELLTCETTIRDSRGRVVKVVKETKKVQRDRLDELNPSAALSSLVQPVDNAGQATSPVSASSSPTKTKSPKMEPQGRGETQRKAGKSGRAMDVATKENNQRDDAGRPLSGTSGASPTRKKMQKPEEPPKKIVKAPSKPSKHSEIMAKLQESMVQDKQKPKKEIRSKFMTGLATPSSRSDSRQARARASLLPMPRSRASSTCSSILGGNQNGHGSSPRNGTSGNTVEPQRSLPTPGLASKVTTPSDEKKASTDTLKAPQSPPAKGNGALKKGPKTAAGHARNGISGVDTTKKESALVSVKKTNIGAGQSKDASGRSSSAAGTVANGASTASNGIARTAPRQQITKGKTPTGTNKEVEQLKLAKERLQNTSRGFEAFSVLVRYYVEQVIPNFNTTITKLKAELDVVSGRADDLNSANEGLRNEKQQLTQTHAKTLEGLRQDYERKTKKLEADLGSSYQMKANEISSQYSRKITKVQEEKALELERCVADYERQRKAEIEKFEAKTVALQEKHDRDVADLQSLHRKMSDDLVRRLDNEKAAMGVKIDELQKLCDRYKQEARRLEGALTKDTEKKMAALTERFENYQREIDSLRSVMDMKNHEMHELRAKCSLLEKDLEELPKCRTRIALLEQKNAELKESLDLKKQAEKLFYQQHTEVLQSCERERERCQRLSMDKEQLEFKLQKLIMSQSAYETPLGRLSGDEGEADGAFRRAKTTVRPAAGVTSGGASSALRDKPMSQSLIQIYAESSPWSPRTHSKTGQQQDAKDLPVTVYMAAQDGDVAKVLQFDPDGECSPPGKVRDGTVRTNDRGRNGGQSSSDSPSPQTPPRGAKSVDKVTSPKRRISPLRRRNVSITGVAPMPATPEHPGDIDSAASERTCSEPPPDCPKFPQRNCDFDGHDPQDPAPPPIHATTGPTAGIGCGMSASVGWTDSGVFTTSCTSDTQETAPVVTEHDLATFTTTTPAGADTISEKDNVHAGSVVNGCLKIPQKNGAAI